MVASIVDQAINRLDGLLVWAEKPGKKGGRRYRWTAEEDAVLKSWYGKLSRPALAKRINEVLRRVTGDPNATRTESACGIRAQEIGLSAYNGEADELYLRDAARSACIEYYTAHRATKRSEYPTVRRGKKRYVKKRDWALWVLGRQAIIEAQSEMLEALEGQVTMTKQQAMERTGLRETHITRYIKAGVFRSWPIPYFQADGKYWLVEAASVEAYLQARSEGRLAEYLDAHPAYVAVRKQMTKEVRTLRRQGRLGKRDPLTEPKSRYHPGCFTVAQVASHVGLSAQVVYKAIQNDQLKAHMVIRGRPRYGIELSEARRYAAWVKNRDVAAKRWHDNRRKAIAEAGLLTVRELAARWGYTEAKVGAWCRRGYKGQRLASRRWGRYLVFEPEDVEEFERKCGLDNKG